MRISISVFPTANFGLPSFVTDTKARSPRVDSEGDAKKGSLRIKVLKPDRFLAWSCTGIGVMRGPNRTLN